MGNMVNNGYNNLNINPNGQLKMNQINPMNMQMQMNYNGGNNGNNYYMMMNGQGGKNMQGMQGMQMGNSQGMHMQNSQGMQGTQQSNMNNMSNNMQNNTSNNNQNNITSNGSSKNVIQRKSSNNSCMVEDRDEGFNVGLGANNGKKNSGQNGKYTCRFEIQIENDKEFQVARRLIGAKVKNILNFNLQYLGV
jgi:hypothetical protein